jgi:peptide/nickel transport system substrate-binding protein
MRRHWFLLLAALLFVIVALPGMAAPQPHNPDSIVRFTEDWPDHFDPAVGNKFSDSMTLANLYDSLVFPDYDGSIKPCLATSWTVSPDNLTYTFKLRKGVKFHNGKTLTADDVVFTTTRLLDIGEGYAYLLRSKDKTGQIISGIKTVRAVDPLTVEFTLVKPFGPFVNALVRLYIMNKDEVLAHLDKKETMYGAMGDYGKSWFLTHDAGSGPYMIKDVKLEEYVMGEKFDDYWGGWNAKAPDFFKIFAFPGEVTIRTLMKNREEEITSETLPEEAYNTLKKIPGVDTSFYFAPHNLQIMLNTKKAPTDDVHFRKALAYIMDYSAVNEIWPHYRQSFGPVPHTLPGWKKTMQYTRDVEKAKAELAQSKYAGQLDKYPFSLSWCAEVPDEEKVALQFQANASEIGVNVEISKKPFGSMIDDAQTLKTTPNGSIVYVAAHYNEAGSMLETRYHSKSQGTWEQCEWLGMPDMDAAIEDALATVDQKARFAKYGKIQDTLVDLAPTIWLADQATEWAYQTYITWPIGVRAKADLPLSPVMGYSHYIHDMQIDLQEKAKVQKQ